MKKVRFITPTKVLNSYNMNEFDCHSPRPFIEQQSNTTTPDQYTHSFKTITFSSDPLHRYDYSNASPNPIARRTNVVSEATSKCYPTNELDLSMLDTSNYEPRKPVFIEPPELLKERYPQLNPSTENCVNKINIPVLSSPLNVLNGEMTIPRNVKDNRFFIKRDNISKLEEPLKSLQKNSKLIQAAKENNPNIIKTNWAPKDMFVEDFEESQEISGGNCHHCSKDIPLTCRSSVQSCQQYFDRNIAKIPCRCTEKYFHRCYNQPIQTDYCKYKICNCEINSKTEPIDAIEKKILAVQKYGEPKKSSNMEVEKQTNVSKEKREPTVADLFKIIKLQNEQLQLLQEKVDKFVSCNNNLATSQPLQNNVVENVGCDRLNAEENKISIGVMTSFEVVRTSTIINKEVIKTNENAQIQCNMSQINIKEVISKTQPGNVNFLDGLRPSDCNVINKNDYVKPVEKEVVSSKYNGDQLCEEKTLNEQSLFDVQVDNAITPLMSPDQTLYLDVRDYSGSDSESDHSNVGWTYYNKVMTHVNGMLHDSDMPSSASALWRNTRQQCMQLQIDKTNVSVMKRVKFGENIFVAKTPQTNAVTSTDTSFKMKQLAAKYLKSTPSPVATELAITPITMNDISMATRNYMERHQIIQGSSSRPGHSEMPRFLDITALKQQPKFL